MCESAGVDETIRLESARTLKNVGFGAVVGIGMGSFGISGKASRGNGRSRWQFRRSQVCDEITAGIIRREIDEL
jgi:hypothetical protein